MGSSNTQSPPLYDILGLDSQKDSFPEGGGGLYVRLVAFTFPSLSYFIVIQGCTEAHLVNI